MSRKKVKSKPILSGNPNQKQQGDVCIETIPELPQGVKRVYPPKTGFLISQGSTAGNRHVVKGIDKNVECYDGENGLKHVVNNSKKKVQIVHEGPSADHKPIDINKGINEFSPVYEMNHLTDMAAPVVD